MILHYLVALLLFSGVLEVLRLFSWEPSGPARLVCGVVGLYVVGRVVGWLVLGLKGKS